MWNLDFNQSCHSCRKTMLKAISLNEVAFVSVNNKKYVIILV